MKFIKWLLKVPYKVFGVIRERFFLVPPTVELPSPQPSLFTRGGMGGAESSREIESAQKQLSKQFLTTPAEEAKIFIGKRTEDFEVQPSLENQRISLCETLDRVLNTGVVVQGDITISVANIDLIYIGLKAILTSVETARKAQAEP